MSKVASELKSFGSFLRDCRAEMGKVTWPNRKELVGSTWVVATLILLLSFFVFFSDRILTWLVSALVSLGA